MCGIAGYYVRKPERVSHINLTQLSKELLFAIDDRGGDACGYVAFTDEWASQEQKAACAAVEFEIEMHPVPSNLRTIMMHTRFATQGKASFPENNHPVRSGAIRVTHNGVIMNDDEVFQAVTQSPDGAGGQRGNRGHHQRVRLGERDRCIGGAGRLLRHRSHI